MKVHIGVSQTTSGDGITTNANTGYTHTYKYILEETLDHIKSCHVPMGPNGLKHSKSIASVTVGSSSPTYKEPLGAGTPDSGLVEGVVLLG